MISAVLRHAGLGPPLPPVEDIDRDLDDEITFHLAAAEADLVTAGVPATEAHARARARFGDVDRIRSRCRRIALEDRVMRKRIHVIATIVLGVTVGVLLFGLLLSARAQVQQMEIARMEQHRAEIAHDRAEQTAAFLSSMLVATESDDAAIGSLAEVLDLAEERAHQLEDRVVAERVLASIAQARAQLHERGADED